METKEKYYAPDLSEFHKGFEFEKYIDGDFDNQLQVGWQKEIADWSDIDLAFDDDEHQNEVFKQLYRVKYLDREDIESLGFGEHKETSAYDMFFYKDSFSIGKRKNGKYEICLWHIKPEDNNGSGMAETLFLGEIKNKSELQVILKQTGVTNGN